MNISSILGAIYFVCGIVVLIKLFQKQGVWHGLLGIITCQIYTFIWGWMHVKDESLKLKTWMWVWTGVAVLLVIAEIATTIVQAQIATQLGG